MTTAPARTPEHEPQEAYTGPAVVVLDDGSEVAVVVSLRGVFQPLDGHFHFYGRVDDDDRLAEVRSGTAVVLRTDHGSAAARLSDRDPWGRFRIAGTGNPPF